ncbi:hypothetical protein V2J23_13245 [Geobacillus thermoleovorans]|uniref:Uncharacterized protein n=2 Tax=Geobacillus TaxID=129337 RepID=A0A0D8C0S6_GEOKU|nr:MULTISPECIES: hypothetical protein [Geobacillus]KJE29217.1 hypothetical protein LG52_2178 [Geobacillus kaustophilus]
MGKKGKERSVPVNEEMAFEWGDFAAHEPLWLSEEQKRVKENEKERNKQG